MNNEIILDNKSIRSAYRKEARSLINKMEKGLNRLRGKRKKTNCKLQLFHLYRYAHTLKGISGTCGYRGAEKAAGIMEKIFREARNGKKSIGPEARREVAKKLKTCAGAQAMDYKPKAEDWDRRRFG